MTSFCRLFMKLIWELRVGVDDAVWIDVFTLWTSFKISTKKVWIEVIGRQLSLRVRAWDLSALSVLIYGQLNLTWTAHIKKSIPLKKWGWKIGHRYQVKISNMRLLFAYSQISVTAHLSKGIRFNVKKFYWMLWDVMIEILNYITQFLIELKQIPH